MSRYATFLEELPKRIPEGWHQVLRRVEKLNTAEAPAVYVALYARDSLRVSYTSSENEGTRACIRRIDDLLTPADLATACITFGLCIDTAVQLGKTYVVRPLPRNTTPSLTEVRDPSSFPPG